MNELTGGIRSTVLTVRFSRVRVSKKKKKVQKNQNIQISKCMIAIMMIILSQYTVVGLARRIPCFPYLHYVSVFKIHLCRPQSHLHLHSAYVPHWSFFSNYSHPIYSSNPLIITIPPPSIE